MTDERYNLERFVERSGAAHWPELLKECLAERIRTDRPAKRLSASSELMKYNERVARLCFFLDHNTFANFATAADKALGQRIREKFDHSV
jgi:hypothetical protein